MTARFICPHCRSPLDPLSIETATNGDAQWRICPNCDEPIAQPLKDAPPTRRVSAPALSENNAR